MKKVFQTTLVTALAAPGLLVSAVLSTTAHAGVVIVARPVMVARPMPISRPVAAPAPRAAAAASSTKPVAVYSASPTKGTGVRPMAAVPIIMVPIANSAAREECSGKSKANCKK